jgi:hypothetical protein
MMMGMQFGATGLMMMVIIAIALVFPFWKLLPRFGFPAWLAVFAIIPLGALILLWILALSDRSVKEPK